MSLFASRLSLAIAVLALAASANARPVDPDNTVVLQLDDGQVVVELNTIFAPRTAAQFKRLVRKGFYDGLPFYRVIDGFVAQGGDGSDMSGDENAESSVMAEFERPWPDELPFVSVQKPDMFAPETGFIDGFAAAKDPETERAWLTHCPGAVGMARGDEPNSGSTDFYIVIGQAPRYLDRNITLFGRVVYGMNLVQRIRRGPPAKGGMIDSADDATVIESAQVLSDMAEAKRLQIVVADTGSEEFREMFEARRHRTAEWFSHTPPAVLDICQIPNQGTVQR